MNNTTLEIVEMREGINRTLHDIEKFTGEKTGAFTLPDGAPHMLEYEGVLFTHSAMLSLDFYDILGRGGGCYRAYQGTPEEQMILLFADGVWVHVKGSDVTACRLGDINEHGVGDLTALPEGNSLEELDRISLKIFVLALLEMKLGGSNSSEVHRGFKSN